MTQTLAEKIGAEAPEQSVRFANILIYGGPGVGKTFLEGTAGSAKETGPIIIADIEGGTITCRGMKGVEVVQIRTMKQFDDLVENLANDTTGYYKAMGVDGVTEFQKLDMKTVMAEQKTKKPETTDIYVPSPREWGKSGDRIRDALRKVRDLEMHVIVTALEAQDTDEQTSITTYFPAIPGKLKNELAGFFDIVGRLESKNKPNTTEVTRFLQTIRTTKVVAKDRFSALPQPMENPTIPAIWELIK